MRPRPFEQGYLAVLAKHSAGRRPAVSSARVWRGSSVLAACGGASDDSKWASVERRRSLTARETLPKPDKYIFHSRKPPNSLPG